MDLLVLAAGMGSRFGGNKQTEGIDENGDFIITIDYPENEWVYGYILSFGEYAKILSPEYAKDIVKKRLDKTIKNYL